MDSAPQDLKEQIRTNAESMKEGIAAAVLCGGRGERLRPLTDYFQKTMIPLGEKKRPLLEYIVRLLAFHEVRRITMLKGYRTEEIREYFKDGSAFGVKIAYSEDQNDGSGSLGALANALSNESIPKCQTLIVYYGDILSNLDITQLAKIHSAERADATLVLSKGYELPVGVASVKGRRIVAMKEKPEMNISVTTGCMALGPRATKFASGGRVSRGDLMLDFVPGLLRRKLVAAAYYTRGFWYDIGTLTNYEKVSSELKDEMFPFL